MQASDFEHAWARWFGQVAPLGFVLRRARDTGWIRFHALPGSKRYAETAAETRVILDRANRLGGEMFPHGTPIWVSVLGESTQVDRSATALSLPLVIEEDPEGDDWVERFDIVSGAWSFGAFDGLLGDIAEDRLRALFFDPATGRVFAPYDGGFDLFWETGAQAEAAADRHPDWLSGHPLGL